MTHTVGPKGQVVIPKAIRDELHIEPGDEVTFWLEGDHVAVRSSRQRVPLRGRFPRSTAAAMHDEDKQREREMEAAKWQ